MILTNFKYFKHLSAISSVTGDKKNLGRMYTMSNFNIFRKQKAILPRVLLIFTKKLCGGSPST